MNKKQIEAALKEDNAVDLIREAFVDAEKSAAKTIEDLHREHGKKSEALAADLKSKDEEIKALTDAAADTKDQKEVVDSLTEELAKKEDEIQSLTEKLEAAKEDPDTLKRCSATFTVNGKTYQFKQGILKVHVSRRLNPEAPGMYPAEEIAKNKKLREALVKINYGGIELVPSKSKS